MECYLLGIVAPKGVQRRQVEFNWPRDCMVTGGPRVSESSQQSSEQAGMGYQHTQYMHLPVNAKLLWEIESMFNIFSITFLCLPGNLWQLRPKKRLYKDL